MLTLLLATILSSQDLSWTLYISSEGSGAVRSVKGKGTQLIPCGSLAPDWCCQVKAEIDDAGHMGEFGCYSMASKEKFTMGTRSGSVVILTGSLNETLLKLVVEPLRPKPLKKR